MTQTTEPVTLADVGYLKRPHAGDPWVPALELELAEPVGPDDVRAAIASVLALSPRLGSRPQRGRWVPGTASAVPVVEAHEHQLRSLLVDTWFAPNDPGSLRVGLTPERRTLTVAWRHAATDAAGGVGAAIALAAALAGSPRLPPSGQTARRLWLRSWSEAARPDAVLAFAAKARGFGGEHAEFVITGPLRAPSATAIRRIDATALREAAAEGGASFTGGIAAALGAACFDLLPDTDGPVTMLLPVNLRPAESRWTPPGNFVGNAELRFAAPPTPAEASEQVAAASGPDRWSAMLAAFRGRAVLPQRLTASGEDAEGRLQRTVVLNNLGHVPSDDLPSVTGAAFLGPTAVDFPSVSLFSVGNVVTVCVRAREHQGGEGLAEGLLAALLGRLGVSSASL